ncbi:MAG TPA: hypothetical protein VNT79_09305, partial [Phycisphaerae bacterium]|nr:hypothetical protein [Phycisphaerae bacterium]
MRAWSRKNIWERTPRRLKSALAGVLKHIPTSWLLGRRFRRELAFVRRAQWWDERQVRAFQTDRLRRIISLAIHRSPFYRQYYGDLGVDLERAAAFRSIDELESLPLMDRETLRANAEAMCTLDPKSKHVDYISTGGSSGVPIGFFMGADRSAIEYAHLVASWERAGYSLDTPQAVFRGQQVSADRDGLYHESDPILRRHYYSTFHMNDEQMARYLSHLATIGPCFLHVYPSSVAALTRFIRRNNAAAPSNVRGILAGSEIVYPDQRATDERVWGARYFSWYGHSEKLVLAAECEHSTDDHVWPTYGYMEIIDENDRPVTTPGERGEIVGTGFINTVMPLIRYRTGDYATYVGDSCPQCGRRHTIIREVQGHRTQELLVAADGSLIPWTALNMHDDTFDRVRQFQFRQAQAGQATLLIVAGDGFGDADVRRIRSRLHRKLSGRIDFDIAFLDAITLTPRGKSVFVDQRMDLNPLLNGEAIRIGS